MDERQVRLRLTERGCVLQAQSAEVARCFLERSGLSIPEAARLRDEVLALRDALRDALREEPKSGPETPGPKT